MIRNSRFGSPLRRMAITGTIAGVFAMLPACAAIKVQGGPHVVEIRMDDCRTELEFYHVHRTTPNGADVVRFINDESRTDTLVFARWPFTGLPHTIFVHAHEQSHAYPISQFANYKAAPDTFEFKLWNGTVPCGGPPQGPGIITDE